MPDRFAYLKMGERDIDNAMPWDKIDKAEYKTWDRQTNFEKAVANSKMRIASNPQFNLIDENAKWLDERNKVTVYSLNLEKFKSEQKKLEETNKKYKSLSDYTSNLLFNSLPYEKELMKNDISLKEKREDWFQSLSKDIYVEEALSILKDLQSDAKIEVTNKIKKEKLIKS